MFFGNLVQIERAAEGLRRKPAAAEAAKVSERAFGELGFEADAAQGRAMNTCSWRVALNCTRQWGKSTVTAAKAMHGACVRAGSFTIAVSPTARQTEGFCARRRDSLRKLKLRVKGTAGKVTSAGNEQYEAGTSGQQDDLVPALSLACWAVRKAWGGPGGGRPGEVGVRIRTAVRRFRAVRIGTVSPFILIPEGATPVNP